MLLQFLYEMVKKIQRYLLYHQFLKLYFWYFRMLFYLSSLYVMNTHLWVPGILLSNIAVVLLYCEWWRQGAAPLSFIRIHTSGPGLDSILEPSFV